MQRVATRFGTLTGAMVVTILGLGACAQGNPGGDGSCGNGVREGSEQCDGYDLNFQTCESLNMGVGSVKCGLDCTFDVSGCSNGSFCGNNMREGAEYCDGADLGLQSCESLNLGTGTLACAPNCQFDTGGCTLNAVCGNGVVEGAEQCDGFNLDGQNCVTINQGFGGGTLACLPSCQFDTGSCTTGAVCGNNLQEGTEECDGADLHGFTCVNLGFAGGMLSCTTACEFDTAGCNQTAENCTNGIDDDGDGAIDCNDLDCNSHPSCGGSPEVCNNGVDDDNDTLIDCDDPDCNGDAACQTGAEICDNGVDDDNNFLCDCNDIFNCLFDFACLLAPTEETNCSDGVDDDLDCDVDCDDSDCAQDPACGGAVEICDNGVDDDGDGAVDCDDSNCFGHASCPTCSSPTTIQCGDTLSGTSAGGPTNIDDYGCGQYPETGAEAYYVFSHGTGGSVTVDLVGTGSADLELMLVGESGGDCDYQNDCLEYSQQSGGTEQVTFTAAAGANYFIIVEGYSGASGPFNLTVTCN